MKRFSFVEKLEEKLGMNKKIKILYISHSPYFNGAEICLLNLMKSIDKSKVEPIVIFPFKGPMIDEMKKLQLTTYIYPLERWIRYVNDESIPGSKLIDRVIAIEKLIDSEKIDIVHTNTSVVIEGALAAKKKGVPHVWHVHEILKDHLELKTIIPLQLVYSIMSYLSVNIITVSKYAQNQFENNIERKKLLTIYNGVEQNHFSRSQELRNELGIHKNDLAAISVGMLTKSKGYQVLLEAVSILKERGRSYKFYWVGGADKKEFKVFSAMLKKLKLDRLVTYLGYKNDVTRLLKNFDILINPSLNEALPTVVLEAMSASLPIIATNSGGTSECLIDGENGYIVPIADPVELSSRIDELFSNRNKCIDFGLKSWERFFDNFSTKIYSKRFEELYSDIMHYSEVISPSKRESVIMDSLLEMYESVTDHRWSVKKSQI